MAKLSVGDLRHQQPAREEPWSPRRLLEAVPSTINDTRMLCCGLLGARMTPTIVLSHDFLNLFFFFQISSLI